MPRTSRLKSCTGTYHVMMRGINHQNIFLDDMDKHVFLRCMRDAQKYQTNISGKSAGQFRVFAYALMGNHFHLLVQVDSGELGEFVKKLASGYVRYFNAKYDRDGHLFRERFKSEPCETYNYFCILMGYIHQNPIKHGFAKSLADYRFTSWDEYNKKVDPSKCVCDVDYVLSKMPLETIKEYIGEMLPANAKCLDIDHQRDQLSDETILEYIHKKYGVTDPLLIKDMDRTKRKEIINDLLDFGGAVRQLSRLTGINAMTISRQKALQSILSPM